MVSFQASQMVTYKFCAKLAGAFVPGNSCGNVRLNIASSFAVSASFPARMNNLACNHCATGAPPARLIQRCAISISPA